MTNKKAQQNLTAIIIISIILIIASGTAGYFLGQNSLKEYKIIVDELFPEPPEEIFSIGGTVLKISDNSFTIETSSLERYLPGKEINSVNIIVNINQDTQIIESDFTLESEEKTISLSDLVVGDYIIIDSDENIRNKNQITAKSITKFIELEESFEEFPEEI